MSNTTKATAAKKAEETPKAMQVVPKAETSTPKAPTLAERVAQVKRELALVEQLDDLNRYRSDLDSFKFGADGTNSSLTITDGERKFKTSKAEHLELVIADLINLIDVRITQVEGQLMQQAA